MSSYAESYGVTGFILPICLFLISIFIWIFPFTAITNLVRGFQVDLDVDQEPSFNEIADFLIVILGLYLLYHAISDIAYWMLILQFTAASDYPVVITPDQKASMAATVIEIFMAVFLILGRKGIFKFIKNARNGGA